MKKILSFAAAAALVMFASCNGSKTEAVDSDTINEETVVAPADETIPETIAAEEPAPVEAVAAPAKAVQAVKQTAAKAEQKVEAAEKTAVQVAKEAQAEVASTAEQATQQAHDRAARRANR